MILSTVKMVISVMVILFFITISVGMDMEFEGKAFASNHTNITSIRMTKMVESHAKKVREPFCRKGKEISPEEWARIKYECIAPKTNDILPPKVANVWDECHEKVTDLCDDSQWESGKMCAKEMLSDDDITKLQVWYRGKLIHVNSNFQSIRMCAQKRTAKG